MSAWQRGGRHAWLRRTKLGWRGRVLLGLGLLAPNRVVAAPDAAPQPLAEAAPALPSAATPAGKAALFGAAPAVPSAATPAREAAPFGAAPAVPSAATPVPAAATGAEGSAQSRSAAAAAAREADLFGSTAPAEVEDPPAVDDDALTLGGFYFLRGQYEALSAGRWQDFGINSPNLLDLYIDARPNSRLRGYVRARALYNPSLSQGARSPLTLAPLPQSALNFDQLWIKFDLCQRLFVTVGRQPIRWGAARFWNPTDFLNRQRLDPLAVFDERLGTTLVKVSLPLEAQGINLVAVANGSGAATAAALGGALRAELLLGDAEVSLSAGRAVQAGPWQLGGDLSWGLGLVDVHAELALQHGVQQTFYRGSAALGSLQAYQQGERWLVQAVAGAEVSWRYDDRDTVVLGAEYFYNQLGYAEASYYAPAFVALVRQGQPLPLLYLGRQYAAVYLGLPRPGSWDNCNLTLSGIANLTDRTYLARLDGQLRLRTYLHVNAFATYHFGAQGELHYAVNVPAGLLGPTGLQRAAPRSEVGVGLRLYF